MGRPISFILRINVIFTFIISLFFTFNSFFVHFGLKNITYLLLVLSFVFNFIFFLIKPKLIKNIQFIFLTFFVFLGCLKFIDSLISIQHIGMPLIGFIGTYFFIFYWSTIFLVLNPEDKTRYFYSFVKMQFIFSLPIALSTLYQYLFDFSLFGFNNHVYLGNYDAIILGKITKRATSFLGPQILGLYLFIFAGVSLMIKKKSIKFPLFSLYFIAGLMTGSATFIGSLLVCIISYFYRKREKRNFKRLNLIFYLLIIIIPLYFAYTKFLNSDNAFINVFRIDFATHLPYYIDTISNSNKHTISYLGNGLGTTDRLTEVIYKEHIPSIWKPRNESYFVKIYYEMGLISLLSLLCLFISIFKKISKYENINTIYIVKGLFIGCLANMVVSPALTGITMAYFIWPLFLFPIFFDMSKLESISIFKP
jgi:hypothetical protein